MADTTNTAPLAGIKVIDWTQVQSGPSCTQLLAWLGAEVIKLEKVHGGDPTRNEMNDVDGSYSLYYLQLNANKKSLTLDMKDDAGKKVLTDLLKDADVFVENIGPGDVEKLGFGWEQVHAINPKCIMASLKGFNQGSRYAHVKAFEPVAQCAGGAASTTGWNTGDFNVPTQSGAALGDSNTGMHMLIGLLAALEQRHNTGEGVFVYQSMHNACLNLCRIKTRDQLTLDKIGYLTQYMQYPNEKFPDYVPRSGNTEGSGVLGWTYKCKGWENDANAYAYIIFQRGAKDFEKACQAFGFEDWLTNPDFNTAEARDRNKQALIDRVQQWALQYDKYEIVDKLAPYGVPCAPVINTKELMEDQSLYDGNTLVKINQPGAVGEFVTVGCPFTMSNYTPAYGPCPELGGNNDEVLKSLGYTEEQIQQFAKNGTTEPLPDGKM